MQSRFLVSSHPSYDKAQAEKKRLENDNPDMLYQIRRGRDTFRVVKRLKNDEIQSVTQEPSIKRLRKRRRRTARV